MGLNDLPVSDEEPISPQLFLDDETDDTGTTEPMGPLNIGNSELNPGNLASLVENLSTTENDVRATSSIATAAAHQAIMDSMFGQPDPNTNEDLNDLLSHVLEDATDPTIARAIQLLNINRKIWKIYQLVFLQMLISMEEDFRRLVKREENMLNILRSLGAIELEKMSEGNADANQIALAGEKLSGYLQSVFKNIQENGYRKAIPMIQDLKDAVSTPLVLPPLASPVTQESQPEEPGPSS